MMRAIIPGIMLLILLTGCDQQHGLSEKEKLARGDIWSSRFEGAPYSCIYLGLTPAEAEAFQDAFTRMAQRHGVRRVTKRYKAYSGGRLASHMSDHVGFFVFAVPTTYVQERHSRGDSMVKDHAMEGDWLLAFSSHCFWTTNANQIAEESRQALAPHTGCIHMVSYDERYPRDEFKALAELLAGAVQTNWPGRTVEIFIYEGKNR